ncbi:hypothetical protein SEA_STLSCUM_93 [Mycobacterium phage STLscum]|nr:hypothetical protein SEA_STLSCUM_93 [Mycobacterium phage STLscum]
MCALTTTCPAQRFDDRADAEEFLAALIDAENFDRNSFGYPLDS